MVSKALFSSNFDGWETPPELFECLDHEFGFKLDAAASHENALCNDYWTPEGRFCKGVFIPTDGDTGLTGNWGPGWTFCNPPYGRGVTEKWVEKAYVEASEWGNPSVLLLPSRTDMPWFHRYVWKRPNVGLRFLPGPRLKFRVDGEVPLGQNGKPMSAPVPSLLAIFFGKGGKDD